MSQTPNAWDDGWSKSADTPLTAQAPAPKKVSSKATKAQKRAQQLEFNRQLWAEAEGPQEPNYYLDNRNVVPLTSEFKPPPILLSRKGPIIQRKPPTNGLDNLHLDGGGNPNPNTNTNNNGTNNTNQESSEDEEEIKAKELTLAERQAQAARDREEKQRKYEERRQELFGTTSKTPTTHSSNSNSNSSQQSPIGGAGINHNYNHNHALNRSGTSTPSSLTPPGSRSATPNRGRGGRPGGGRGGRGGGGGGVGPSPVTAAGSASSGLSQTPTSSRTHSHSRAAQQRDHPLLYDPSMATRPARENGRSSSPFLHGGRTTTLNDIHPVRMPRGPDGSGRGGFGFSHPRLGAGTGTA